MTPPPQAATLARAYSDVEIERELCRRSLIDYVQAAWEEVHPNDFHRNWHVDAIVEHLEACYRGEIRRLVMNVPPRMAKSTITSVMFPTWVWTKDPGARFLCSAYSNSLASRDGRRSRDVIRSRWYQARWGEDWQMQADQDVKSYYVNTEGGHRVSIPAGTGTGEGGDYVIVDDPHDVQEAESPTERRSTIRWWRESMPSRVEDPKETVWIIIAQRVHRDDLSAWAINSGLYEVLSLPMEYGEGPSQMTWEGADLTDPRTEEGALIDPERYPREEVEALKTSLGKVAASAQLNQNPRKRSGDFIAADKIETVEKPPERGVTRVIYIDKAATASPNASYSAWGMFHLTYEGVFTAERVQRGQWSPGVRDERLGEFVEWAEEKYGKFGFSIVVEQEPGSGGKESAQETARQFMGYRVYFDRPTGGKFVRADPFAARVDKGDVQMVEGAWNDEYVDELDAADPDERAANQVLDQMDISSGGYNWLVTHDPPVDPHTRHEDHDEVNTPEDSGGMFQGIPADEVQGTL